MDELASFSSAPDIPTFEEKGYPFFWEQMRGIVGPKDMPPEAVAWWQDTLKKVTATKKWQDDYIKPNLLTPTAWTGEEANKYLDGLTSSYESALGRDRRPEEVGRARKRRAQR